MAKRFGSLTWLSFRDYRNEWQMSGCFVLALAAVLGPMLILFGLKAGIIGSMLDQLLHNPRNLEIQSVGAGRYDRNWIDALSARDDVGFVVPQIQSIAANLDLKAPQGKDIVQVQLVASRPGDPMLGNLSEQLEDPHQLVLTASAADKLGVSTGDQLDGSVARRYRGRSDRVHLNMTVVGVLPQSRDQRVAAYVALPLALAVHDFRNGWAVPELGWTGDERPLSSPRLYAGFRLYAAGLDDVTRLAGYLEDIGLQVKTRAEDIAVVQAMDRNLTLVFWIVALIGLLGFSISLGASLWANVDRKRRELSMLRLVGFHTGDIIWYPILQALLTAFLGWLLAVGIYYGVAWVINHLLVEQLQSDSSICRLEPLHLVVALGVTLLAAGISAGLAGLRAARIEPAEGLREI